MLFCSGKWANSLNCSSPLRSHSNHCNDNQEALEDYGFCYKPVINPYKSSELHYLHFKPLIGVRASQHSSCIATLTEFEACKTQAGNPQMQALCLIHNLPIQKMMVNVSLLFDSPITSSPQYHSLQVLLYHLWVWVPSTQWGDSQRSQRGKS